MNISDVKSCRSVHNFSRISCDCLQKPRPNADKYSMGTWHIFELLLAFFLSLPVQAQMHAITEGCNSMYGSGTAQAAKCIQDGYGPESLVPSSVPIPQTRPTDGSSNTRSNSPASSSSSRGGSAPSMASQCQREYQSYYDRCSEEIEATSHSCDEKNDEGMTGVAAQVALMLGQQTGSNVQAACGQMANVSQAANAAVAAYRIVCNNAISTCKSQCKLIEEYVRGNPSCGPYFLGGGNSSSAAALSQGQTLANRCKNFDAKMNQAQQAIQNYGNTAANASACSQQTAGDAQATPDFCKANPNYPSCQTAANVDCNNPELAATNKVCVCAKNPTDPMCFNQDKASGSGNMLAGGNIDSSSRQTASSNEGSDFGDIPSLPSIAQGEMPDSGPGEAIDGRQGNGAGVGGFSTSSGSAMSSGSDERGKNNAAENPALEGGGFYGGGSGGKFGSYAGSEEGGSGRQGTPGAPGTPHAANGQPDLRQFLPGGKFDPRGHGFAGSSGPDGITGPASDIWQKIQNRYRVLSHTLMP